MITVKVKTFQGRSYFQPQNPERGKIEVCRFPDRQKVALSISHGSTVQVLAYFCDEESAEAFMRWMDSVADGEVSA